MEGLLVARIRGIEVRANWSIAIIGVLIAWSLAESVLPDMVEGRSDAAYWAAGGITAAALLAALVAHELGHSLVALGEGVWVRRITLWMLGGLAELESEPDTPRSALRIAGAGPVVSAGIGVIGLASSVLFDGLVGASLQWFGVMNLVLAVFNLIPAYPLDGGRIYQAWQWRVTGEQVSATERASDLGQRIGALLVAVGFFEFLFLSTVGGLWLMVIGWFIREAARAERRRALLVGPLSELTVRQVMSPTPLTVRADVMLENFVAGMFFGGRHAAYPVVADDDRLVGLVTLNAVRAVEPARLDTTTVGDVAEPLTTVPVVQPDQPAADLVEMMAGTGERRALVLDADGSLAGIVAPSDIARLVAVVELAGPTTTAGR